MMNIIVCGSDDFLNYYFFKKMMFDSIVEIQYKTCVSLKNIEIICSTEYYKMGLLRKFSDFYNIRVKPFDAKWNDWKSLPTHKVYIKHDLKYGDYNAMAGMNRNYEMFEYAGRNNGVLVAFWQNKSKGTKNMIDIAKRGNMPRLIYNIDKNGFDYKLERIGI